MRAAARQAARTPAQPAAGDQSAFVAVQCSENAVELLGFRDRREVLALDRGQGAAQIARGVPLGASGGHRIAEHLTAVLECTVCRLQSTALLDAADHAQELGRGDRRNRSTSHPGEDVPLQPADGPIRMTSHPVGGVLVERTTPGL